MPRDESGYKCKFVSKDFDMRNAPLSLVADSIVRSATGSTIALIEDRCTIESRYRAFDPQSRVAMLGKFLSD